MKQYGTPRSGKTTRAMVRRVRNDINLDKELKDKMITAIEYGGMTKAQVYKGHPTK